MRWRQQLTTQLTLAVAALFVVLPLLWMARLGLDATINLRPTDFALFPKELSFARIAQAWEEPRQGISFLGLLGNSLISAGSAALAALIVGLPAAYAFARLRFRGRRIGLIAMLTMIALPPAALAAPYFLFISGLGLRRSLIGLVMAYTAIGAPFVVWTVRNAVLAISRDIEEAAMLEGASGVRVFLQIVLPLCLPAIAVAGFIAFLVGWSEYAFGWAILSDPKLVTLAMALNSMRDINSVSWGILSATSLLTALPVVVLFYLLGSAAIDGLSLGAARNE